MLPMSAIQRDVLRLIAAHRWAALATLHDGGPAVSMVAYAVTPAYGELLVFLSELASHTRDLLETPECAVAISTPDGGEGDPQVLPRVSVRGRVERVDRDDARFPELAAAYAQRFPESIPRFQLGDFHLFRVAIDEVRHVGGFARAATFTGDQLRATAREMDGAAS